MSRLLGSSTLTVILVFLVVASLSPVPHVEATGGGIVYERDVVPEMSFRYENHSFWLEWRSWYLRIEPFAIYRGVFYGFDQIVPWLRNTYPNVDFRSAVDRLPHVIRYGYWLEKLPQKVADDLDYLGFRLLDHNIPLGKVNLEEVVIDFDSETREMLDEPYNITRIHIAGKFTLSFEDLWPRGYTVEHVNKTWVLIGGVRGRVNHDVDPIVFGGNIITVTGFTAANPCTFWDLWNASNVLGWNVTAQTNENTSKPIAHADAQFLFACSLQIGDGVVETWFGDTNKQVKFTDDAGNPVIEIKDKAVFRLGELLNAIDKTTRHGCSLVLTTANWGWGFDIFEVEDGGTLLLYSSIISDPRTAQNDFITGENAGGSTINIYHSQVHNIRLTNDAVWNLEGVILTEDQWGPLLNPGGTWSINDLFIHSSNEGIRAWAGGPDVTINSLTLMNTNIVFNAKGVGGDTDLILVNPDVDSWSFSWNAGYGGECGRQYTFNLLIVNATGYPLENATCVLYNNTSGVVFNVTTNASGVIAEQTVSRGHYNQTGGNIIYDYGPFSLVVTNGTLSETIANITINEPIDWTVSLEDVSEPSITGLALAICAPIAVFGLMLIRRKR